MVRRLTFFALLAACVILAAQVSQRHGYQVDLTAQRSHSLTPVAQAALDSLQSPLGITAFVPQNQPLQRARITHLLTPYLAHPGGPSLHFVDPVEHPALAREQGVARHGELHLAVGARREVIAVPNGAAIDRALNRLALRGQRWVVSLKGHGEATLIAGPTGLSHLVAQVEDLGYRFITVDPRETGQIPDNTEVLLVAAPQDRYDDATLAEIDGFLDRGGALFWLMDGPLPATIAERFGIQVLPGVVVDAAAARHGLDKPDNAIVSEYPQAVLPRPPGGHSVLKQARGLALRETPGWREAGRLHSSPRSWNETGGLTGRIERNPDLGEQAGPLTVGLALAGTGETTTGRAVFLASRHVFENDQLGRGDNLALAIGLFHWLTANTLAAQPAAAPDLTIRWSPTLAAVLAIGLMGVLPTLYLALGLWRRRRRRRA